MVLKLISLDPVIGSPSHSRKLGEAVRLIFSREYSVYSKIIQLCTNLRSKRSCQMIHCRVITDGFIASTVLNTKLIMFYFKFGEMENARKLFDKMSGRNVVTWTALVSGYSQNGYFEEALNVFSLMHRVGVKANQFTYGSALSSCTQLLCLHRGKQIQAYIQKGRFVGDLFVQSALIDLHAKCGIMQDAVSVFESMEMKDLVSWNALIGGHVSQGSSNNAILVFRRMLREGMLPDSFSFGSILRSCSGNDGLAKVKSVHGCILHFGLGSNKFLTGSLINAYVNGGSLDTANRVYNNMRNIDVVSCTALIKGYACEGTNCSKAFQFFNEIRRHVTIDGMLLCLMLNVCAKTASLSLGQQLHADALKYENRHDVAISNALIDMYSKSGVVEDAKLIFYEVEEKNIISWTSLITGLGKHGYGLEAIAVYEMMKDEGLKPNDVTFLSLLYACTHNGLVARGWEYFRDMASEHNILPRAKHYSCLVDLLARAGCLEEAYDLVCKIPGDFGASALGAILGACSTHSDTSIGPMVAKRLLNLDPNNSANHVTLSRIYAASGLWNSARTTRMLMGKKTMSRYPGYSLCQSIGKQEELMAES